MLLRNAQKVKNARIICRPYDPGSNGVSSMLAGLLRSKNVAFRLIRAVGLDVAGLLALVAQAVTSSLLVRAALGGMAAFTAIVALLTGAAVTAHMTKSSAREALWATLAIAIATAAAVEASRPDLAIASNMASISALVALGSAAATTSSAAAALVATGIPTAA